ncbi:hypothetical protein C8F04DRAFT_1086729 [Mycena alexandri]|uniref:Uncharacterized protein n=1 Tax=Mycena alexandri TaxID=1745969 RepID=A0AAD6X550_9AGAR|nr:hypothetical protein C8F04DRAFT_1086729 [Mycena alexandri]
MIHATPASDQAAVDWIMGVMREKDVPVHIMVFNSLIAQQKNRKDFRKALAYYNVIIRLATTTPLKPNAVTYKLLFRLYGYHYKNNHKPNASRNDQPTGSLIPPRQLFADMMSLWFSARFHPPASSVPAARSDQSEADQSLVDITFRSFLYLDDYAAAIVVLRTTVELGLRITVRTYFTLLRYMARKVYYEVHVARVKQTVQPVFAFELMGPFEPREIADDDNAAYEWIMERLLEHNSREAVRGGDGSGVRVSTEPRRRVPSVAEILEQDGNPTKMRDPVDVFPLISILRRALQIRASSTEVPWGDAWRKQTVTKARYQMVPKGIPLWSWSPAEKEKMKQYKRNEVQ